MPSIPRNPAEAESYIRSGLNVTRQMVTQAKTYLLLQRTDAKTKDLLDGLREHVEAKKPVTVIIHPQTEVVASLKQVIAWISWTLAGCEAIWELVHANLRLPWGAAEGDLESVEWTTVIPGSGGTSSGWVFRDLSVPVPQMLIMPPSFRYAHEQQPLSDPDLFLAEIGIEGIHLEIQEAIREAVMCFRHELYTACLAMLGKAAEGAWIELGFSLLSLAEDGVAFDTRKVRETIESPMIGMAKKINEIVKLYERQDVFGELAAQAEVRLQDLRNAVLWADVVRDSRNSVHYGVQPAMRNSYEKVGAILIGAIPHLKILYRIINARK